MGKHPAKGLTRGSGQGGHRTAIFSLFGTNGGLYFHPTSSGPNSMSASMHNIGVKVTEETDRGPKTSQIWTV